MATIKDPGTVRVAVPPRFFHEYVRFIGMVQEQQVVPDSRARVLINSQTGTVVVNERVKLSKVAIMHGNISVITGESAAVSQPLPFSQGATVVVPQTDIDVQEERTPMTVLDETTTVGDLAMVLNALSVSPRDVRTIFSALKSQNALHAELIIR